MNGTPVQQEIARQVRTLCPNLQIRMFIAMSDPDTLRVCLADRNVDIRLNAMDLYDVAINWHPRPGQCPGIATWSGLTVWEDQTLSLTFAGLYFDHLPVAFEATRLDAATSRAATRSLT